MDYDTLNFHPKEFWFTRCGVRVRLPRVCSVPHACSHPPQSFSSIAVECVALRCIVLAMGCGAPVFAASTGDLRHGMYAPSRAIRKTKYCIFIKNPNSLCLEWFASELSACATVGQAQYTHIRQRPPLTYNSGIIYTFGFDWVYLPSHSSCSFMWRIRINAGYVQCRT